ncbi:hypothetical protein [Cellulosimicrobium sp. TH-20]|uniref:hypothetical protein n=1 Tax=Cellulosimicrobium sp. TH-20 TaxID=1980001 RepID=UPI0011A47257|nr:hypothetical protein [Cellulosimicrobium sp. TH-20]
MSNEDASKAQIGVALESDSVVVSAPERVRRDGLRGSLVAASAVAVFAGGAVVGVLIQRHLETGIDWAHLGSVVSNFGPAATVTAAIVALVVGLLAWGQKRTADARDQFWKRLQWTLDKIYSGDPKQEKMGNDMLAALGMERHARRAENHIISAASQPTLEQVPDEDPDEVFYLVEGFEVVQTEEGGNPG